MEDNDLHPSLFPCSQLAIVHPALMSNNVGRVQSRLPCTTSLVSSKSSGTKTQGSEDSENASRQSLPGSSKPRILPRKSVKPRSIRREPESEIRLKGVRPSHRSAAYLARLDTELNRMRVQGKLLTMYAQAENSECGSLASGHAKADAEMVWSRVEPCLTTMAYQRLSTSQESGPDSSSKGPSTTVRKARQAGRKMKRRER